MKILVVEDDQTVAQTLHLLFSSYHYAVDIASNAEVGLEMVEAFDYNLLLFDIRLPGLDGLSLCQKIRYQDVQTPILLLTGEGGGHQKAIALNAGADDYVVKPFDAEELMARVQALLRRGGTQAQPTLMWGELAIDPSNRRVAYGTHLLSATPKEYAILELLLRNKQRVLSVRMILDQVWPSTESPGGDVVRVHIKELRKKLKAVGAPKDLIKTVYGTGYRLNPLYSTDLTDRANTELTKPQIAALKSVNEELRDTLAALQLAHQELSQKNQALAIAHQTIAQERQQIQLARDELEDRVAERTAELFETTHQLQQQLKRDHLIAEITDSIRRTLDLDQILQVAVEKSRQLLQTDRVIVFRFQPDWRGCVVAESVGAEWTAILSTTIRDPCFAESFTGLYRQGRVIATSDTHSADIDPCYLELLSNYQVQANLVVPILQQEERLWGLLIAHHCATARQWDSDSIQLLKQVAIQLGVAIQQAELYQQTHRELQERRQFQNALQESEERFRALSTSAPIGIYQTDINGDYIYTNPYWQKIASLTLLESLGDAWKRSIHPGDQQLYWETYDTAFEARQGFEIEYRLQQSNGEDRWIIDSGVPRFDSNGNFLGYIGSWVDISDRKQAEQKIREQAALLDITSDAIFVRDLKQHILYWNKGAEQLYGWSAAEAVGQKVNELLQNDDAEINRIMHIIMNRGEWQGEIQKVTRAGKKVIVETRWTLARNELGQPSFILSVDTDITDKQRLESQIAQAQRLESVGSLASGIAHDLNNILTPILTIAQLMRLHQTELDAQMQDQLKLLEASAKQGANMVKHILSFARGDNGDRVAVDVIALLQDVIQIHQHSFSNTIEILSLIHI